MVRQRYLAAVLAGVAALAVARPFAQQAPRAVASTGPPPLTVDFLAVSKDDARSPILDLTSQAVTLKVAGKNRVITNLKLVKLDEPSSAAVSPAAPAFRAPFATNVAPAGSDRGRRIQFVIDTESIRPGAEGTLRTAVTGLLTRLGPHDQVGVAAVPHGGMNIEVTRELNRVRDAISTFTGAAQASETVTQATDRSRLDVEALTGILSAMSGAERPTTIIYVGSSLMGPSGTAPLSRRRNGDFQASTQTPIGQGDLSLETFQFAGAAVSAARAQVFVVQVEGGMTVTDASSTATSAGLASLASLGGGEFFTHLALGEEDAIARIGRETSAYYVATVDGDASDKSNTRYPIALSSSRADVRLLWRPDYELVTSASNTPAPTPGDMLMTARAFRDLPIRAVGYSMRPIGPERDRLTWVKAFAELVTPGTTLTAASAGLYRGGQLVARFDLPLTDLAKPLLPAVLQVPPGQYRLRFAATDGKRSGAVDCPIDVGLTPAGSFRLSSLTIEPKLQFSSEAEAWAAFELYGQNIGQQLSIEVLLSGAGTEPKRLPSPKILPTSSEADRYIVRIPIPLADLPPGDYQVRVTAGVVGEPGGTLTATVRKVK